MDVDRHDDGRSSSRGTRVRPVGVQRRAHHPKGLLLESGRERLTQASWTLRRSRSAGVLRRHVGRVGSSDLDDGFRAASRARPEPDRAVQHGSQPRRGEQSEAQPLRGSRHGRVALRERQRRPEQRLIDAGTPGATRTSSRPCSRATPISTGWSEAENFTAFSITWRKNCPSNSRSETKIWR